LWDRFEKTVNDLIVKYVPKRQITKHKKNEWISKETIKLMEVRSDRWRKYRTCKTSASYSEYKKIRNKVTSSVKADQDNYRKGILKSCKENPKKVLRVHEEIADC